MLPRHLPVSAELLSLVLILPPRFISLPNRPSASSQQIYQAAGERRTRASAAPSLHQSSWQPYSNWTIETGPPDLGTLPVQTCAAS